MPPNHVSAPALSLANLASVVVAAHQKRLAPQLPSSPLPAAVVNGAGRLPAEGLARPPGTLLGSLAVLPALRAGLAQMAAAGRPTPAGLIAMPVPSSTVSGSTFYRRLAAVQTPITWDAWKAGTQRRHPTSVEPWRESAPPATSSPSTSLKASEPQRASVVPRMQCSPRAAAQGPAPSTASLRNAAACQPVWERIRAVRADWMLRDTGKHPTQRELTTADRNATRQGSTGSLEAADRVRAVRKLWHGREAEQLTAATPPSPLRPTVSMPRPSAVLLQAMALHRSASPDPARLDDLLRGLIPKPSATLPHPPHRYPTLPQRSEFHPFGIKRALDRLRG